MIRALYSAASGMRSQEMNVDNIANNLANANTAGYKSRRAQFQDLMYQSVLQPGTAAGQQTVVPTGLQLGLGTRPASNEIVFTQGSFSETDNPLDMVIQGNGFFQITLPSGELAYTRCGQFQLDKSGNLVTASGNMVQPQITIPPNAQTITIAGDGTVTYTLPNQSAAQQAGQIHARQFPEPGRIEQPWATGSTHPPTLPATPPPGLPAAPKAWARCCRATTSSPTSPSSTSSST